MRLIWPALATAIITAACAGSDFPTRPDLTVPPNAPVAATSPSPVPPGPPLATLEIVRFSQFGRDVQLILAETGGVSGATFGSPVLVGKNGNTDTGCDVGNRIVAGGRWSMESMGYCAPVGDGSDGVSVIIDFTDDAGRRGTFTATMGARQ